MDKNNRRNKNNDHILDETRTFDLRDHGYDEPYYPEDPMDYDDRRDAYYDDIYEEDDYYEREEEYYTREDRQMSRSSNNGRAPVRKQGTSSGKPRTSAQKTSRSPQKQASSRSKSGSGKKQTAGNGGRKKKGVTSKQYIVFYVITLIAAVAVCLAVFFAVFNMVVNSDEKGIKDDTPISTETAEDSGFVATNEISTLGMISSINVSSNRVQVFDVENLRTVEFSIGDSTVMKSRSGEDLLMNDFAIGDIVDCRYADSGSILTSMTKSSKAWEQRSITNARINLDAKTIVWGNESYNYTDQLKVLYNGSDYSISQIESDNVITMRGTDRTVWFIEVNKGVGILEIINGEEIKNGIIEIEGASSVAFDGSSAEDRKIKMTEGLHKITIKGENIENYVEEVLIESGQTTSLDLTEVQVVAGVLNIKVNVSDAIVYINDKAVRASEPQVLSYGTYNIKVQHNDYDAYEETVEIDTPTKDLNVTLKEKVQFTRIEIDSDPAGAEVYIDDAYIGIAPVTAQIDMESNSKRHLTVKMSGYAETTVQMNPGQKKYKIIMPPDINAETDQFFNDFYGNQTQDDSETE